MIDLPRSDPPALTRFAIPVAAAWLFLMSAPGHANESAPPPGLATSSATTGARRAEGPAGSLVIVEETRGLPIVAVMVAARTGAASDGPGKSGLAGFAAELARRSAGGKTRAAIDDALDALGASLEVDVEADSIRCAGQVLVRNLDPFLDILASIVLAPDFSEVELARTRDELLAQIEEARNDDRSLCSRFFDRRVCGEHPYG
ncbi:MAG TPA: insulinase family protein, partial [Polyangia bacterium]